MWVLLSLLTIFLVVEIDMPYRDGQVEIYGESFRRWEEDSLDQAMSWLKRALPIQQYSVAVCLICLYHMGFQVYHDHDQVGMVRRVLKNAIFDRIYLFALAKLGPLCPSLHSAVRCQWLQYDWFRPKFRTHDDRSPVRFLCKAWAIVSPFSFEPLILFFLVVQTVFFSIRNDFRRSSLIVWRVEDSEMATKM